MSVMLIGECQVGVVGLGYVGQRPVFTHARASKDTVGFDLRSRRVQALDQGCDPMREEPDDEFNSPEVLFTRRSQALSASNVISIAPPTPIDESRQAALSALISANRLVGRRVQPGSVVVCELMESSGLTEEISGAMLKGESSCKLNGAQVGILGVTFQENVYDTRNSRVPDIARELGEFGIQSMLYDPLVEAAPVRGENELDRCEFEELSDLHGLILAVAHRQLVEDEALTVAERLLRGVVFVDRKSTFSAQQMPGHVAYWSL